MRKAVGIGAALLLLVMAVPSFGGTFSITATFDSSITGDAHAAAIEGVINSQISMYESLLKDPINVTIQFGEMTSGLGQSTTGVYKVSYQTFINQLTADATSATDATALAHLPTGANNPVTGSTFIDAKSANLRAIGINAPGVVDGTFDGAIGLNTHITDVGSSGTTGQYSLAATVDHEIDEVLGLGSDVGGTGFFATPAAEDLFRYDGSGNRSYTPVSTAKAYFSLDGTTLLAQFDNQNDGGDFGDWQSNPLPGGTNPKVQDAFATPGSHPTLGVEVTALDAVGYDLQSVPEPGSLALLGTGLLAMVGTLKRKKR